MKKCPKGIICISNFYFTIGITILIVITYYFFSKSNSTNNKSIEQNIIVQDSDSNNNLSPNTWGGFGFVPNYPYNNLPGSVLLNPFSAPLKDERYFVPINIPTNIGAVETTYRQLGILTPLNGEKKNEVLPLMGRPLFTNRQKFQYYTISNQHNNVKLPVIVKGRSGTSEYGVDELYTGDTIYLEGLEEPYRCNVYENDTIRYLPYL